MLRSLNNCRSANTVAKPLSADEIVKANAKKRAAGQQPAGPAKAGRLDAAAMAALVKKGLNKGQPASSQALDQARSQALGQTLSAGACSQL